VLLNAYLKEGAAHRDSADKNTSHRQQVYADTSLPWLRNGVVAACWREREG